MINLILFRVLAKSSEGRFGFICLPLKPCFWTIMEPEETSALDDRIQDNKKPTLLRRLLHAECSLPSSAAFVFKPHLKNFHNKVIHSFKKMPSIKGAGKTGTAPTRSHC